MVSPNPAGVPDWKRPLASSPGVRAAPSSTRRLKCALRSLPTSLPRRGSERVQEAREKNGRLTNRIEHLLSAVAGRRGRAGRPRARAGCNPARAGLPGASRCPARPGRHHRARFMHARTTVTRSRCATDGLVGVATRLARSRTGPDHSHHRSHLHAPCCRNSLRVTSACRRWAKWQRASRTRYARRWPPRCCMSRISTARSLKKANDCVWRKRFFRVCAISSICEGHAGVRARRCAVPGSAVVLAAAAQRAATGTGAAVCRPAVAVSRWMRASVMRRCSGIARRWPVRCSILSPTPYRRAARAAKSAWRPPRARRQIEIRVSDNGPGIPGRAAGTHFSSRSSPRVPMAPALGSAVVQAVMRAHAGELRLNPRPARARPSACACRWPGKNHEHPATAGGGRRFRPARSAV